MTHAVVAIAYGGPDVLTLVEDDPGDPGPEQVLIEVRAAGVNPADWKSYTGVWGNDPDNLPLRLGFEAAGVVLAVGPEVEGIHRGDEVIAYPVRGAYADRLLVPASAVVHKPATLDWPEAGSLMLAGAAAVHAITATRVGAGDTVLVHGASGAVGTLAVQLAHLRGARVVGTASPENHEVLLDLGASPVAYGPGLEDRIRAAAPGGVHAVIDTAGTDEALDVSVALVTDRRRIATLAGFARGAELGVQLLGGGKGADPGTQVRHDARTRLAELAGAGKITVQVGATYALDDVARAHRAGMQGRVQGKIVLLPSAGMS
ncbi:NADP-dependent oxidoreductase [Actinotalea sp. K2]|uniref:NADP-dependent oxidoreductase n=1 Tax=Actinotalea sp. K2 TaxID=2939438 RepID=UPI002017707F|nr:NADP-dependent oxidoreductase [Actinotalea sp. K2]MCL3861494.1 NADP-dependent oxidoreductase [Actinotalea sp. K2]